MRTLLIIPSFKKVIYENTKIKAGRIDSPLLSLAVLAANITKFGHETKILDLNLYNVPSTILRKEINDFKPQYVGVTFVTPLFNEMVYIANEIKKYGPDTKIIGGGAHASSLPKETLTNSPLDIVVIGEGDFTILDIVEGKNLADIPGIAYKYNGKIIINHPRKYIEDLDTLPFPAWQLYDLRQYKTSKLMVRKNPAGWIETSRGCPFNCCYCNKSVFGKHFRVKTPERVVDEIDYMLKLGFKEIHIADDMFTTNVDRIKKICEEIIKRKLNFPWATVTGIRVDRGDQEMYKLMARAGCYRVYYGIESGNQEILNNVGKKITLEQVKNAVRMAKKAGLETCGFFMLALPGETEKTMKDTINFACELNLDLAKVTITTPLPGTTLYNELEKEERIKTKDWSKYNLYLPANRIYEHENLNWKIIEKYFNKFYRKFYWRPEYVLKRLIKSISQRALFYDLFSFLKTKW